jgi:hypothetical protein
MNPFLSFSGFLCTCLFVPQEACFVAERNSFFLWYSSLGIPFCLQNVNKTLFSVSFLSLLDCRKTNSYRKKCNVKAFEVHCFFFLLNQACVVSSSKREEHRIPVVVGLVSVSLVPGRTNAALEHLWVDGQRVVEQGGAFSCALIDVIHFAVMSLYD